MTCKNEDVFADRAYYRISIFIAAVVESNGSRPITLRNISPSGAMGQSSAMPAVGTSLLVKRGRLNAVARVVWVKDYCFGLAFDYLIQVEKWIGKPGATPQTIADQIFTLNRIPDLTLGPNETEATQHAVPASGPGALDLTQIVSLLSSVGDVLAEDLTVVGHHGATLQLLDHAIHLLRYMANRHDPKILPVQAS